MKWSELSEKEQAEAAAKSKRRRRSPVKPAGFHKQLSAAEKLLVAAGVSDEQAGALAGLLAPATSAEDMQSRLAALLTVVELIGPRTKE